MTQAATIIQTTEDCCQMALQSVPQQMWPVGAKATDITCEYKEKCVGT